MTSLKKLLVAGMALSLMGGAAAQAQGYDRRDDHRGQHHDVRDQRQDVREAQRDVKRAQQNLRQEQRDLRKAERRYQAGRYQAPRGYKYHAWRKGERLPQGYYASRYSIREYNRYGLHAPPRGYQWTRVGNDAVLVGVTSGLVSAVVSQLFY
jgi:Ni/Co efflux regulator RcnB